MDREIRYTVFKNKDLNAAGLTNSELDTLAEICEKVNKARADRGKAPIDCVVVESDWPEYDDVWWSIAARVDNTSQLSARIDQIKRYGVAPKQNLSTQPELMISDNED